MESSAILIALGICLAILFKEKVWDAIPLIPFNTKGFFATHLFHILLQDIYFFLFLRYFLALWQFPLWIIPLLFGIGHLTAHFDYPNNHAMVGFIMALSFLFAWFCIYEVYLLPIYITHAITTITLYSMLYYMYRNGK